MKNSKMIALLMMIKNEEARITVSFDSVKDITNTFIILDTGSTDQTLPIIKKYCEENKIDLHLKEKPFINFEVSRNDCLEWADEVCKKIGDKYLLLLDCNDELQNSNKLLEFVDEYKGDCTGFHLKQNWWTGKSNDTYYNMRFVKSNQNWRYKGVVHEYMYNTKCTPEESNKLIMRLEGPILFQDRTKDDDKSAKRFFRDKELLYPEYLKNPKEPRTLFYLAQTCGCIGNHQEAYKYYILRLDCGGFEEEIYHSYYRLGEISMALKHSWEESLGWFLKAFGHSQRVEPLLRIVDYYRQNNYKGENKNELLTAYMFCEMACKLVFPVNQILFIDRRSYDYTRWHYMGIIGYYIGRYKEGKEACLKALEYENNEIDMQNLLWYLKKERELSKVIDDYKKGNKNTNSSLNFSNLICMSLGQDEIAPAAEITEKKFNRKDILEEAIKRLIKEIKNK